MKKALPYDLLAYICKPNRPWPAWVFPMPFIKEGGEDKETHYSLDDEASTTKQSTIVLVDWWRNRDQKPRSTEVSHAYAGAPGGIGILGGGDVGSSLPMSRAPTKPGSRSSMTPRERGSFAVFRA